MVKLDVPSPVLHWILGSTYKNISVQMWIFHLVPSNNFFKLIPIHAGMVGMLANTAFLCRSGHLIQFAANIFFINWSLPPVPWQVMGWQKWLFCEDLGIWFKSWQKHFLLKLTAPHHHEVYENFLLGIEWNVQICNEKSYYQHSYHSWGKHDFSMQILIFSSIPSYFFYKLTLQTNEGFNFPAHTSGNFMQFLEFYFGNSSPPPWEGLMNIIFLWRSGHFIQFLAKYFL